MGQHIKDLLGQRFGTLTVLRRAANEKTTGKVKWECRCDCGAMHVARGSNLTAGKVGRCRRCASFNVAKPTPARPAIRVYVWYNAVGAEGGFACAEDEVGHSLGHTQWSRIEQKINRPTYQHGLARRMLTLLAERGHIRPIQAREGPLHWAQAVRVEFRCSPLTPWAQMLAVWGAAGGRLDDAHPMALAGRRPPPPPSF